MKSNFRRFLGCFSLFALGLVGCAGLQQKAGKTPTAAAPPSAPQLAREVIVFIPQNDESAAGWLKLFERYPHLRLVIAMSPRFQRFIKDPALKAQAQALIKAGRLELALQLPNAPFLPLIINTDAARQSLPPGTPLPSTQFSYSEDVSQVVARSKADFYHVWNLPPKGLVLPHGAASPELLKNLDHLALAWVVGAFGMPSSSGPYKFGSLMLFDAVPTRESPDFSVQVWDEREPGSSSTTLKMLNVWAGQLDKRGVEAVLPADNLAAQDLPSGKPWGGRTWMAKDWSAWIGTPRKNTAWEWLKKTRDALEAYKNSGRASVRRLDMAFEEMYTAESSNFFSGIHDSTGATGTGSGQDLEHEFKATLASVYRLMGQPPPDDLFETTDTQNITGPKASATTMNLETLPDGRMHLDFNDPADDDHGSGHLVYPPGIPTAGAFDLRRFDVYASTQSLDLGITLGFLGGAVLGDARHIGPLIDIYIDLNGQPNVGTVNLLPGRQANAAAADAWEYALAVYDTKAQLYRTRGESFELANTLPVTFEGNTLRVSIPRDWMRGNPRRWGYQVLVMAYDPKSSENDPRPLTPPVSGAPSNAAAPPIYDLLDPVDIPQAQLLSDIEQGQRNDIPFLRFRNK